MTVLALDIGGTKIAGALVDEAGDVRHRADVPTPAGPSEEVWSAVSAVVERLLAAGDHVEAVGVGCAGPMDAASGTVSPVNVPSWRDFPLAERLTGVVGDRALHLANDAACAAVGEHWRGAGRGVDDMLLLVVSTGVGGGLVLGGRLHPGPAGNAGHVGHAIVDLDGDPCPCGAVGCVEGVASGTSMLRWARARGWTAPEGSASDGASLAAAVRSRDAVAVAAYARGARALAAGIVSAAASLELTLAVLGGGVMRSADVYLPMVRAELPRYARLGFLQDLRVEAAVLGDDAGLLGAAALALEPDRYGAPGAGARAS